MGEEEEQIFFFLHISLKSASNFSANPQKSDAKIVIK
jgi:hypothetical protein